MTIYNVNTPIRLTLVTWLASYDGMGGAPTDMYPTDVDFRSAWGRYYIYFVTMDVQI